MIPDRIEREILIDAPPDVVWTIVTEAEHVGTWFSDSSAEIDLRPGGRAALTWEEHGSFLGYVERVDPPHSVAFRWARPAGAEPAEGNSTLVEFILTAESGGTRLRVVESGFQQLDGSEEEIAKYVEGNEHGWEVELRELSEYVGKQVGASARG
jgi:uncharacterized protein YndB with AHSA1/START domain